MTEQERDRRIEALAAEKVLGQKPPDGYELCADGVWRREVPDRYEDGSFARSYSIHEWPAKPLTRIADAFALLEAHPEWRWWARRRGSSRVDFSIHTAESEGTIGAASDMNECLPRAITYAAIRAVGAGADLDALLAEDAK